MLYTSPALDILAAPHDQILAPLTARLHTASESLHVVHFTFSLADIYIAAERLVAAGKDVRMVGDLSQSKQKYEMPYVAEFQKLLGANYVIGVSPLHHQIVHTKLVLIDHTWAWLGSANLTHAAALEQNLVLIMRDTGVITALEAYFERAFVDTRAHPKGPLLTEAALQMPALSEDGLFFAAHPWTGNEPLG